MIKGNKAQEEAIHTIHGPVILISCPGSGKTTTLIRRIHYMIEMGVDPSHILMVTFTKASAEEMKHRYQKMFGENGSQITFCTIHSMCLDILKREGIYTYEDIMSEHEKFEFLTGVLKYMPGVEDAWELAKDLISDFSRLKNSYIDPDSYEPESCEKRIFLPCFNQYESYRKELGKIDYEDMMLECKRLLEENPDILKKWQTKYQYIQCDEYQDTNLVQKDILYLLAGKNANLCVVGDDDQSIYRFRGARPSIMFAFRNDFDQCKIINMSTNYRSAQAIVDASDILIKENKSRFEKAFISDRGENGATGEFHYLYHENKNDEMKQMIALIKDAKKRGIPYNQIAILFRTNKQAQFPMSELLDHDIPFVSTEKITSIYNSWIFNLIRTYIRLSIGKGSNKDILYVLNRPTRYLKPSMFKEANYTMESLYQCASYLKAEAEWKYKKARESISEWMNAFGPGKMSLESSPKELFVRLQIVGIKKYIDDYAKLRKTDPEEYLRVYQTLFQDACKFDTIREWYAYGVKYIKRIEALNQAKDNEGVQLTTMHKSKGREWSVVFVIDVNEDIVPHKGSSSSPEGIEEERRLLYVAMTRAKDELYVMASGIESPFIASLMEKIRNIKIRTKYPIPNEGTLMMHKTYGMGIVEGVEEGKLFLDFAGTMRKFVYPDVMEKGQLSYVS